jgi:Ca2+-binding RTX toxin-like protein
MTTAFQAATTALNLIGDGFAQSITGTAGANIPNGLGGTDRPFGGDGNQTLKGEAGNVVIFDGVHTIPLKNVGIASLSADDFLFETEAPTTIGAATGVGSKRPCSCAASVGQPSGPTAITAAICPQMAAMAASAGGTGMENTASRMPQV